MSYLALARKWRPRTFSELVGQEHINKALVNALKQQRLHHAYLFTGTRGVGKTSIARILAKALNCESGITAEPCLQCDTCVAIEQGRFIDLIEIDGASKTRVEDTRDLLENVQYAPTSGRFKIYLIDEVHMLSQHSFNALLKTLEEPPAHVKFILATTDPQKLPVTVLSRCLQFNLKHLPVEVIAPKLQHILNAEQFDYEPQAIDILAHAARGSMRDALSILDQAITSSEGKLLTTDVKTLLGYTQKDYALLLLKALLNKNAAELLSLSQQIIVEGGHFQYVLDEILSHLHQVTIYQHIADNPLIPVRDEIKEIANELSKEDAQLFYQIAIKGQEEIHLAPTLAIGFNMTLLRMLTFRPATLATTPPLEFKRTIQADTEIEPPKKDAPVQEAVQAIIDTTPPAQVPQELPKVSQVTETVTSPGVGSNDWATIISQLQLTGIALNAVDNAAFIGKEGRDITLAVASGHLSLFTPTTTARIEAALSNYYNNPIKLILNSQSTPIASPAQEKVKSAQQKQEKAIAALQDDPVFQQVTQEFSAELVKNSIVLLKDEL